MHPLVADAYTSIRRALDPSLTADALSDDLVTDDLYLLPALAELERMDPDALTYAELGDTAARFRAVRLALCYLVAAEIAPVLPVVTSEKLGDYQFTREKWDGSEMAGRLRGKAGAALATYLQTDGQRPTQRQFTTAPGYRGR